MERGQLVRQAFQPVGVNSLERLFYGLAMGSSNYAFLAADLAEQADQSGSEFWNEGLAAHAKARA